MQIAGVTLCGGGAHILGYVDDGVAPGVVRDGATVLGNKDYLYSIDVPFFLLFGMADPGVKQRLHDELRKNPLITFPNTIHPKASVSEYSSLGEGIVIAENCLASVDSKLGNFVFLNYGAMIGHDAVVGDYTSVMPSVAVSGNVEIGERCLLGVGSLIKQGIRIGNDCTVGMGSVVIRDVPDGATVMGNPAGQHGVDVKS
jgi:sugar O-acyltransferase (sialic acid O-acetyltransferase NeuD family)